MLDCSRISDVMAGYYQCESTDTGARISTHCMYPSFEQVSVFIVNFGDDIVVHDGGGAMRSAWDHGRNNRSVTRVFSSSAASFGCEFSNGQFQVSVPSEDWLFGAVATIANASSDAARAVTGKARVSREDNIIAKAKDVFDKAHWGAQTKLEHAHVGDSGKMHSFDLAVFHEKSVALIDAVVPHPNSIASKYLAFSDSGNHPNIFKYAVIDGDLPSADKSLISNVADVISINSIVGTDGRYLLEASAA